ncbi:MAG TPA: riboflavin biosynthesis protein RibF [Desulfitobacteriaceae bacterium]|nr:riboflavin biosynthesis protein RibF [Desulfitobacteriaceae bacterium]
MQIRTGLPEKKTGSCIIALGNFDGVHLGHHRLLESALFEARHLEAVMSILMFDPHPLKIIKPEKNIKLLTTIEQRLEIFEKLGVDQVYILPFTRSIAKTSPRNFIIETLLPLGVIHVFVGFNYSFGAKGQGTPEDLRLMGYEYGFKTSILQAQSIDGHLISSSHIRKALELGDIYLARKMLGRAPLLSGTVIRGEQRGRLLCYPTANVLPEEDLIIPKCGVYAIWADFDNKRFYGMMNIGRKPTFHEIYHSTVEVHFFNYQGDLYGKKLNVYIAARLRDERRFSNDDELIKQLERDKVQAKRHFL